MHHMGEDAPLLVAQAGPLNGQRWTLVQQMSVGREPTCDIVISDRQVSRKHAIISPTPQGVILEDLDSKNGTHCNGHPFDKPVILQDGDIIQIALAQQFVFLSSDATLPLTMEYDINQPERQMLRLEKRSRRVWIGDREVLPPLSVSQFTLLELLYEQQGKVVARKDLIKGVWGEEQAVLISEQALDALVRRLRDRLANIDPNHAFIITIRGHGLRLDNPALSD